MSNFNSCQRLLLLLEQAKKEGKNDFSHRVWGALFDYSSENLVERYEHLFVYHQLLTRAIDDVVVNFDPDEVDPLLEPVRELTFLYPSFNDMSNRWPTYGNKIEVATLRSLKSLSARLSKLEGCEQEVNDDVFKPLYASVDALFDAVFNSDLPRHIRLSICDCITGVKRALNQYRAHGAEGVSRAFYSVVGGMAMNKHFIDKSAFSGDVWGSFRDTMATYLSFIQSVDSTVSLANEVKTFLTGGSGGG